MPSILSLPREVRYKIYKICLIVHYEIIPHPTNREVLFEPEHLVRPLRELPSVALVAINKQIRAETRPILYYGNHWRLPTAPVANNLFQMVEPWLFQYVTITLRGDDVPGIPYRWLEDHTQRFVDNGVSDADWVKHRLYYSRPRSDYVHDLYFSMVCDAWKAKVDLLEEMSHLRKVVVNIDQLRCPTLCCCKEHVCCREESLTSDHICRLLENLSRGQPHFVYGPPDVLIEGTEHEEEDTLISSNYGFENISASARRWSSVYDNKDGDDNHDYSEGGDNGKSGIDEEFIAYLNRHPERWNQAYDENLSISDIPPEHEEDEEYEEYEEHQGDEDHEDQEDGVGCAAGAAEGNNDENICRSTQEYKYGHLQWTNLSDDEDEHTSMTSSENGAGTTDTKYDDQDQQDGGLERWSPLR